MVADMAHILGLSRDQIKFLVVGEGSTILRLLMPTKAVNRLIALYEANAPIMQDFIRKFEVEKVRVIHKQTLQTLSSVPVSPREELSERFQVSGDSRWPSSTQQKVIPFRAWPVIDEIAAGKERPVSDEAIGYMRQTGDLEFEFKGQILKAELLRGRQLTFFQGFDYFATLVSGDSMDQAGIAPNDYVILRKPKHVPLRPSSGDVVAVVFRDEDDKATLKRFYFDKPSGRVALKPESSNPAHKSRVLRPKAFAGNNPSVEVVGIAIAVLKPIGPVPQT
jgi:hypothetical protein